MDFSRRARSWSSTGHRGILWSMRCFYAVHRRHRQPRTATAISARWFLDAARGSAALVVAALASAAAALTPVPNFDLNRYAGTWYEIASIPGFLQSLCARDTQVDYSMAENGALAAQTRCMRADGTQDVRESRVRTLDPATPGALKITTVNFLGIWWYPFGRESIVIAVGPDYRWLVLGHPSLKYGRVIAREPALANETMKVVAAALGEQQFDLCKFVTTPQTKGREQPAKLCEIIK